MPNAASTKQKLETLANYIAPRDPATADRLRDLGAALAGGPSGELWAFSNIRAVLDPDRISYALVGDPSADTLTRGMEVLRNSLVLLPLAITWFGIALAVDAYYKLVGAHPELAGQSFIYLWQSGFQGRMPLPLGTLAVIDAFLLAGVFGLTLAAYARGAWLSLVNWKFGAGFGRHLNEALADAELILAPRRGAQYYAAIQTRERNAQQLLDEIADERGRVAKLAEQREQEFEDLNGITDNLRNSSVVFLNAAESLANTHTATLAALNAVAGTVKGLAVAQQDVMKAIYNVMARLDGPLSQRALDPSSPSAPNVMTGQPRAQQDTLRNIESLLAAQQESLERLLVEQRQALRAIVGQAGGMSSRAAPSAVPGSPAGSKVVTPPESIGRTETLRKP